jgi:hypothetical protein
MDEQCRFMANYLRTCLNANPAPDDYIHSGFEAGHTLAAWLKHLQAMPEASSIIASVADHLAAL